MRLLHEEFADLAEVNTEIVLHIPKFRAKVCLTKVFSEI